MSGSPIERFLAKIRVEDRGYKTACWVWAASKYSDGYGQFGVSPKHQIGSHRFAYNYWVGPIPDGLELDHLCRVRECCNPEHLEPVTHKVNMLRGLAAEVTIRRQRSKSHCPYGHPYAGHNLYLTSNGWRQCRACSRRRYENKRIAA